METVIDSGRYQPVPVDSIASPGPIHTQWPDSGMKLYQLYLTPPSTLYCV